jgi:hypothetical protein
LVFVSSLPVRGAAQVYVPQSGTPFGGVGEWWVVLDPNRYPATRAPLFLQIQYDLQDTHARGAEEK